MMKINNEKTSETVNDQPPSKLLLSVVNCRLLLFAWFVLHMQLSMIFPELVIVKVKNIK